MVSNSGNAVRETVASTYVNFIMMVDFCVINTFRFEVRILSGPIVLICVGN